MATKLRQVLEVFDETTGALSVGQLARQLHMPPSIVQQMLDYWVRKGELRDTSHATQNCASCGVRSGCPFVMALPKQYERVHPGMLQPVSVGINTGVTPCTYCK